MLNLKVLLFLALSLTMATTIKLDYAANDKEVNRQLHIHVQPFMQFRTTMLFHSGN